MRVAAIQSDTDWEDPEANFAHLAPLVAAAAADGAELVLLPEMFSTGFSMATERVAEAVGGPSEGFLAEMARAHRVFIGGSCPVRLEGAARPYNRFLLLSPDGSRLHYDKIHPFGYGGESDHYAPGSGTVTTTVEELRVTPFVCYDLRFADRFWDAAHATDAYLVVANWPAARAEHWRTLLRARAIENLAYVVGVNRVGDGDGIAYGGGSLVVEPFGEIVAEAGSDEQTLLADLDANRVADVRARYGFLEDR